MSLIEAAKKEVKEVAAVTLYFLIGFAFIFILLKLLLAEYEIEVSVVSLAVIGALIVGKVVVVMNHTKLMSFFQDRPGYVIILYKTTIYVAAVFIVLTAERVFHAYRETGALGSAFSHVWEGRDLFHALGVTVLVAGLFIVYNSLDEISRQMGKDGLRNTFLGRR